MDRPTAVRQHQSDRPGPSSAPIAVEEGEIDSETDQDPSILEVPAINWARYVRVKSVQYVKKGAQNDTRQIPDVQKEVIEPVRSCLHGRQNYCAKKHANHSNQPSTQNTSCHQQDDSGSSAFLVAKHDRRNSEEMRNLHPLQNVR